MPRKPREKAPENETPEQRFKRLAEVRVSNAIEKLRLVSNLATHAHTPEQAQKIIQAIDREVESVHNRFKANGSTDKERIFSL